MLSLSGLLLLALPCLASDQEWKEEKSRHFIVHYLDNDSRFARTVAHKAEEEYRRISTDLGFKKFDNYWTWGNRAKIYIYKTKRQFTLETKAPPWASGKAEYKGRKIYTCRDSSDFIDSILPHEMTHLVFRDFMGFEGDIPLWLDEGVAEWEEKNNRTVLENIVRDLMKKNGITPLRNLTIMDVRKEKNPRKAVEFYAQSASLVGFMIKTYGSAKFRKFCGQLRDGKAFNNALRFTYPEKVRTIEELEARWKESIRTSLAKEKKKRSEKGG